MDSTTLPTVGGSPASGEVPPGRIRVAGVDLPPDPVDAASDPDEVPAWAYAPVVVVDHDPTWAARADRIAAGLDRALQPWRTRAVEHVGSTSVPGLAAKPVIDLMVPVRDLADHGFLTALRSVGWAHVPPALDGRRDRRFFVLPDGARRIAHLHLMDPASSWRELITFRDLLRADPTLREAYAGLKRGLATAHGDDREAYTRAKASFVITALARPAG